MMNSDRFDSFVQRAIDACTNSCGAMSVCELARIVAIVGKRGTPPRRLRESLRRLGYRVRGDQVVGLSARTAAHYVRSAVGESVDVTDVLATMRPGVERRYVEFLITDLATDGLLLNYSLH